MRRMCSVSTSPYFWRASRRRTEELAEAHQAAEARGHGSEALRAHVEGERRRRVVLNLRSALEQRASEARLLYLLKTQREALDAAQRSSRRYGVRRRRSIPSGLSSRVRGS